MKVHEPKGGLPGVCKFKSSDVTTFGFFVPYLHVGDIANVLEQWEALIRLFVRDTSKSSSQIIYVPFLIDTGTDVTIIPRNLIPNNDFLRINAVKPYKVPVTGLTGKTVFGDTFNAHLSIVPFEKKGKHSLDLGEITIVIVNSWEDDKAVLGLDAIRRVLMISDSNNVYFWPPSKINE
jgi:hypothetical protein